MNNIFKEDLSIVPFGTIAMFVIFVDTMQLKLIFLILGLIGLIYQILCCIIGE